MFEGAALAFRFDPFNGEDCWAYPAYLAVPADLTVVADPILAGDPIVVVDQSAVVDPTAPADHTVGLVRIVEAVRIVEGVRNVEVVRNVPAVHIWVRNVEAAQNVPVVHIWAQIAAEALRSLAVAPNAVVDHYVVPVLNVTVRKAVRNAANEVQIALAAQLAPDATVSPEVRRTAQIEAFPIWGPGYRKPVKVDGTTQFVHVDHENVSPRHDPLASQVERLSPVGCLLFLADQLTAIHLRLAGAPLVYVRLRNSSATQESPLLILTASKIHLPDLKRQESSVHRHAPHAGDA